MRCRVRELLSQGNGTSIPLTTFTHPHHTHTHPVHPVDCPDLALSKHLQALG